MPFLNIFSTNKEPANQKIKIIADNREKQSLVISELISKKVEVTLKQLEIGDYIVNDVVIERKTISDLKSSIIDKRIFHQLQELQKYPKNLLIIEGISEEDIYRGIIHENALRGFLLTVALEYKVPLIFTKDSKDTALYLLVLSKKTENKELSLRHSRSFKSKKEQLQYILEGFPNIGPITAKKLIESFHSLKSITNAQESDLKKILGKKTDDFIRLLG